MSDKDSQMSEKLNNLIVENSDLKRQMTQLKKQALEIEKAFHIARIQVLDNELEKYNRKQEE